MEVVEVTVQCTLEFADALARILRDKAEVYDPREDGSLGRHHQYMDFAYACKLRAVALQFDHAVLKAKKEQG